MQKLKTRGQQKENMLFNSVQYILFFLIIFLLYWYFNNKSLQGQNILLLVASYYFYSCWDWRFVFLLAFSTALDYFSGILIYESSSKVKKKIWLMGSVCINLGFLVFFKYYNFFIESFAEMLRWIGFQPHYYTLQVILPVGISFYTFHGMSYVFDIYNVKIKPRYNWINYALFVCFFPLLVAGPIERATHLLPQIEKPRSFEYSRAVDGLRQILWGFFKKLVIADNCAIYANQIFNTNTEQSGSNLVLGAIFFTFQIYGDFSGYSDIALGSARLLGIELLKNFNFPYFSRDIAEFWRRWHISLSSWFKDYLYIPLGGSKGGDGMRIRNTFIIFLVSGFWHGANWTFIMWGAINALFILPSIIMKTNRNNIEIAAKGKIFPTFREGLQISTTFILVLFCWIFFRAESLTDAFKYISGIFDISLFSIPTFEEKGKAFTTLMLVVMFMIIEWLGRENNYAIEKIGSKWSRSFRWAFYACLLSILGMFIQTKESPFIYFQF